MRAALFRENLDYIERRNAENISYTLGVNKFADMTREERRAFTSGIVKRNKTANFDESLLELEYPESVDWRLRGAVTPV